MIVISRELQLCTYCGIFVVYLEKENTYRIISARKATPKERNEYEEGI